MPEVKAGRKKIAERPIVQIRPRPSAQVRPEASSNVQTPTATENYWKDFKRSRQLELRLLHNFTISTSLSFPGANTVTIQQCWSVEVPKLGLQYEPLLDETLAISALHLSQTGGNECSLLTAHAYYSGEAVRGQRERLEHLSQETADAVCFTSILLLVDAFAILRGRTMIPYIPPVQWMHLARGTGTVTETSLKVMDQSKLTKVFPIISSASSFTDRETLFRASNRRAFARLISPTVMEAMLNDENDGDLVSTYEDVLSYIGSVEVAIEHGEHPLQVCRRLMVFPLFTSSRFITAVEEQRPQALIILAHLFALSAELSHIWWIGQTGRNEVLAINDILPSNWKPLMKWPIRMVTIQDDIMNK